MIALAAAARDWTQVRIAHTGMYADARQQCHHAAQIVNAPAISYLRAEPDDSHTNFIWMPELEAWASHLLGLRDPVRFALRPRDLALLAMGADGHAREEFPLAGKSIADAHAWVRGRCVAAGGEAARYTEHKHYEIRAHAVAAGRVFGADAGALAAMGTLWGNAVRLLEGVARMPGASSVRLWPHHFDVGVIITLDANRSIGCGFTQGDGYYDEPYWYTSPYPKPEGVQPPVLSRGAHWHEVEFFSAVLPWSSFGASPVQGTEVSTYLLSALGSCRTLLGA